MRGAGRKLDEMKRWRLNMKKLFTTVAMAALIAGVTSAYAADQQATSAELDNALNWQAATSGAYASARVPGHVQARVGSPNGDFQLQGR